MYQMDYHLHSDYSDDSWYLMEDVIRDAIALGLNEICFTDHVDYGVKMDWQTTDPFVMGNNQLIRNVHYDRYFADIDFFREKYQDQITLKKGLELGIQTHTIPLYNALIKEYPLDFALLSIHQVDNKEFWTGEFTQDRNDRLCYQIYYQELFDVVRQFDHYSVLAHFDIVRRYVDKSKDTFLDHKDMITQILKYIIDQGKGIELNTSSTRYQLNGLTPSIEILKLYHQLGGTIITVGSDSHKPAHLGFELQQARNLLHEIGFRSICTFDQMNPVFHTIK